MSVTETRESGTATPPSSKASTTAGDTVKAGKTNPIHRGGETYTLKTEHIHNVILEMLGRASYCDLTMDMVAAEAGVSKRTLYQRFPSKKDLVVSAIKSLPVYEEWAQLEGSFGERVWRASNIAAQHPILFPSLLSACVAARETEPELLDALNEHIIEPRLRYLTTVVDAAKEAGEVRPDLTPESVFALITGVTLLQVANLTGYSSNDAERRAMEMTRAVLQFTQV